MDVGAKEVGRLAVDLRQVVGSYSEDTSIEDGNEGQFAAAPH